MICSKQKQIEIITLIQKNLLKQKYNAIKDLTVFVNWCFVSSRL